MRLKEILQIILLFLIFICFNQRIHSQNYKTDHNKYWVFFKDKGFQWLERSNNQHDASELGISEKSLVRRSKVDSTRLIDNLDLPVYSGYIRIIQDMGLKPVVFSRWLNGVTVFTTPEMIKKVSSLSFVRKVKPVISFYRSIPEPVRMAKTGYVQKKEDYMYDYGNSFHQNDQIRVPELHNMGLNGRGVLIGMIDTGFDYEGRNVFSHMDIVNEYDFHWDDSITANQENDPSFQDNHGTQTLSIIGGFWDGKLIGPAFGASYILAKTEWVASETRIEEDHWVEAIEWMEREGVEIVSSSLGYSVFDGGTGYAYDDMNGDTCITTRAADIAASKGVVVVTSAGNERDDPWFYILSPADGDSVIAVGAVDHDNEITSFSSAGPTADGRIKPDVVALGQGVVTVFSTSGGGSGTSFSCPLAAGVCGLILQAHPELRPMQVREALRETADRSQSPDNLYGWGLIDAYDAVFYHGVVFTNFTSVDLTDEEYQGLDVEILWKYSINPDSVYLHYKHTGNSYFTSVQMVPVHLEDTIYRAFISSDIDLEDIKFYVSVKDSLGNEYKGPIGAPYVLYEGLYSISSPEVTIDKNFELSQNYPNPFNSYTFFPLVLAERAHVSMEIYNIIGQKVKTIYNGVLNRGVYERQFRWNGNNESGFSVTSGIYILKTTAGNTTQTCKIIYVK